MAPSPTWTSILLSTGWRRDLAFRSSLKRSPMTSGLYQEAAVAHPRSAGCYARVLGRYVREEKKLSLLDALRKCSLLPAQLLEESVPQMKNKGRIKVGADADIIVFDPKTVIDRATYAKPNQTSLGMRHVIVNGVFVIKDGELKKDSFPGKPVRRPEREFAGIGEPGVLSAILHCLLRPSPRLHAPLQSRSTRAPTLPTWALDGRGGFVMKSKFEMKSSEMKQNQRGVSSAAIE